MHKLLFLFLFLLSFVANANLQHLSEFESASLFRSTESHEHNYPVMAGAVLYQAEIDDMYSEGYYMSNSINFTGKRLAKIYDYDQSLSLEFILSRISSSLRQQGYSVKYECQGIDCGKAEAFPALFGKLMDSREGRYGYQLFSRNTRHDDMLSVFATLIDSRVRVTVNIFGDTAEQKYIDLRPTRTIDEFQGLTVYFGASSTTLNDHSVRLIQDFAGQLLEQPAKRLLVRGHTDQTGNTAINKQISSARAEAVHKLLSKVYDEPACKAQSFSNTRPYFHPLPAQREMTDRRVEIVILQDEEFC